MKQNRNTKVESLHVSPPDAKPVLASDLLEWLKQERNILTNSAMLMWVEPNDQKKAQTVAYALDITIQYIENMRIFH